MRELIINQSIGEVRAVTLLGGKIFGMKVFRSTQEQKLGGLYWGRVKTVSRDLDGAFVSLGSIEGESFLPFRHAKPIAPKGKDAPKVKTISNCVYEGQIIPVEIIREAIKKDNKLPQVRTRKDIFENNPAPKKQECISPPPTPVDRAILWAGFGADKITFDNREKLAEAQKDFPDLKEFMVYADSPSTLMEDLGINDRLDEAQSGLSALPGGGSILIEETASIVAFDVNTGKAGKGQSSEKVRLQTNIEAAHKIADEIMFQNLSGLMVIDFIDLSRETDRRTLLKVFDGALRIANVEVEKTGISKFGLLELRRKKQGPSLPFILNQNKIETEGLTLLRLGLNSGKSNLPGNIVLEAIPPVLKWVESNKSLLKELQNKTGRKITLEPAKSSGARLLS